MTLEMQRAHSGNNAGTPDAICSDSACTSKSARVTVSPPRYAIQLAEAIDEGQAWRHSACHSLATLIGTLRDQNTD